MANRDLAPQSPAEFAGYDALLRDLKARVRAAQIRAALAVNRELVLLYWQIGGDISRQMREQGWGAKFVDQLATDLRREFPDLKGFSPRNLRYMRSFAEAWPDESILQQVVAKLPWGHNVRLLDYREKGTDSRIYASKHSHTYWGIGVSCHGDTAGGPAEKPAHCGAVRSRIGQSRRQQQS